MDLSENPFTVLAIPYDASPGDVRHAFRRLAHETHPDGGGSALAFHQVRLAYGALTDDLDGQRRRWQPPPAPPPDTRPHSAGLGAREYPVCPVHIRGERDGGQVITYLADKRPRGWTPGHTEPPGATCEARYPATDIFPAFGVWVVLLDEHRFRCVFGPHPEVG